MKVLHSSLVGKVPLFIAIFLLLSAIAIGQTPTIPTGTPPTTEEQKSSTKDEVTSTTTPVPTPGTTTLAPELVCGSHNGSCEDCVEVSGVQCVYCHTTNKCIHYPWNFPPKSVKDCAISNLSWGTCIVTVNVIIITVSVVAGILVLALIICCCCCCRKRSRNKWAQELAKWERERKERSRRQEERRLERQARTDEIRKKYGLFKEDNPYSRFDNK